MSKYHSRMRAPTTTTITQLTSFPTRRPPYKVIRSPSSSSSDDGNSSSSSDIPSCSNDSHGRMRMRGKKGIWYRYSLRWIILFIVVVRCIEFYYYFSNYYYYGLNLQHKLLAQFNQKLGSNINDNTMESVLASTITDFTRRSTPTIGTDMVSSSSGTRIRRGQKQQQSTSKQQIQQSNQQQQLSDHRHPLREHPHAGARDAFGNYGYVANVTQLRSWMTDRYCSTADVNSSIAIVARSCTLPYADDTERMNVCDVAPKDGIEGQGWDALTNVIRVNYDLLFHKNAPKVLCAVYTYERNHKVIRGIAETWGWRCDGFFAASTATTNVFPPTTTTQNDYEAPPTEMIDLVHAGEEDYTNMWQKTRSILSYMYDHYLEGYDYFYIAGDDTHLIVENLKQFLLEFSNTTTEPIVLYSGQVIKPPLITEFVGGGGGYVISREALRQFVERAIPTCYHDTIAPEEDMYVTKCMAQIGIPVTDSTDQHGRQRFFHFNPNHITSYWFEYVYFFFVWHWAYQHGYKSRNNLISPASISFHSIGTVVDMKRHHAILYQQTNPCPPQTKLGSALSDKIRAALSSSGLSSSSAAHMTSAM